MKKHLAIGLAAAVGVVGASVFAGDEHGAEKPQMFTIYKEVVKPAMIEQYEDAIRHMISEFKEYQIDPEKVHWKTVVGPELGYVYVMPVKDWANMDQMHKNWMEAIETIGKDRFKDMMDPAMEAMDHMDVFQVVRRGDLSYEPENPRLKPDEVKYIYYGFYYALPGKGEELEAIAKDFVELYKSNGVDTGWSLYQSVTGSDLPLYVVAQVGKSAADFQANRERLIEELGEEAKKLSAKVAATVRKMEFKEAMPRPDLSYPEPTMDYAEKEKKEKKEKTHDHDHDH